MKPSDFRAAALALALACLTGCASLTGSFQGFNARAAGGYSTVAYIGDVAGELVEAGAIEPDEGENLLRQATHLRVALDMATEIHSRDPDTAAAKLAATLAALHELRDYIARLYAQELDDE